MPTVEWSVPFDLITSEGTLLFNQSSYPRFNIDRSRCRTRRDVRAETDPIPQGDGDIFHERYATGIEMTINCQPWLSSEQFACEGIEADGESLVTMRDELYQHLWALLRPVEEEGTYSFDHRIIWTPTGQNRRMLDQIRLLAVADPTVTDEGLVSFEFTVDTPYPYAMSLTETTTTINDGASGTVANAGNVEFWPVIKAYANGGPMTSFTITNDDTGLLIDWDQQYGGAVVPSGEYAEIDTFRGTMFLNGDEDDLTGGVIAVTTDYFPIRPGGDQVSFVGGGADRIEVLHNDAFA